MSEIKITKNSIENSIISNGQVTIGSIDSIDSGESNIVSNSSGSMAIGYIDSATASNIGACISATGLGAFASGYAYIDSTSNEGEQQTLEYHNVIANGHGAHAEGCGTYAGELYAHAEGYDTTANGNGAHAEGYNTQATGDYSHAGGMGTIANQEAMTVIGKYNNTSIGAYFVVGNGDSSSSRKDAFVIDTTGNVQICGNITKVNNVSIGNIATAKVNNVPDVYLGCPIGTVVMWAGENAPYGWLLCDGKCIRTNQAHTSVNNDKFSNLFNVIGKTYGYDGDGKHEREDFDPVDGEPYSTGPFICVPDLQQRFSIGAEIGGVGNITDKGSLDLYYSRFSEQWYYVGNIKIGQFLDLTVAITDLERSDKFSEYCKIIDTSDSSNYIGVIKCDSSGKTIDNTIHNLFGYYRYSQQSGQSFPVSGIKIKQNEYSTILGSTGGEETHKLSMLEIAPDGGLNISTGIEPKPDTVVAWKDTQMANQAHNNIPPYLAINFIIKYK